VTKEKNIKITKPCNMCGKEKKKSDFYKSYSIMHKADGLFHFCKSCMESLIDVEDYRTVMNLMRMIDRPYIHSLWIRSLEENPNRPFGVYMKNLGMPQNRDKTWDDSEFEVNPSSLLSNNLKGSTINKEVLERWRGWDEEEILALERIYQDLIAVYEHKTPIQRSIYRNIAIAQMKADEAIASGNVSEYEKLMRTISNLMNDAKIKPLQDTGEDSGGLSTWGEWVKKIEETEPIPEPRDEFKDVDGIRRYIDKWFVGHFAKVFGLTNNDGSENVDMLVEDKEGDK
jgi:hypothetical protein